MFEPNRAPPGGFQPRRRSSRGEISLGWNLQERDFEILILRYWYWDIDIDILILRYWYWDIDIEILILRNWYWDIDIQILIFRYWYLDIDIEILILRYRYWNLQTLPSLGWPGCSGTGVGLVWELKRVKMGDKKVLGRPLMEVWRFEWKI